MDPSSTDAPPTIAVAIPCFNEAAAIGTVIAQFRAALPGAEIVVFDNNSTDGTGEAAQRPGRAGGARSRAGQGPRRPRGLRPAARPRRGGPGRRRRHLSGRGGPARWLPPSWKGRPTWSSAPASPSRAPGDVAGSRAGQPPDPRGVPPPDRPGHRRPALGLPRLQPEVPPDRSRSAPRASRSRPSWPSRP